MLYLWLRKEKEKEREKEREILRIDTIRCDAARRAARLWNLP